MSQDPTDGLMLPIQQSIPPDVGENAPNSPALAPINTPPEIYASIEQMFEINPDLLAPTSSGMDEMWVTSLRQSSVSSVDSSVAASHGSYNDKFKPSIPVRQRPDTASTAQLGQHLIQRQRQSDFSPPPAHVRQGNNSDEDSLHIQHIQQIQIILEQQQQQALQEGNDDGIEAQNRKQYIDRLVQHQIQRRQRQKQQDMAGGNIIMGSYQEIDHGTQQHKSDRNLDFTWAQEATSSYQRQAQQPVKRREPVQWNPQEVSDLPTSSGCTNRKPSFRYTSRHPAPHLLYKVQTTLLK
ncbi:hypothetical protein GTA08_BOTSDO09413 [Botryosphaeria dothidea]|uniref:Uncharacterized protein n=1 Tax=Botryosphaeria dothidea TaxID=55169 RepID=A0A8H4IKJ9_9PEZI|nr:hypothetical protein GTA08_BOTSDO09413 [Botryosphaeria dothidea]